MRVEVFPLKAHCRYLGQAWFASESDFVVKLGMTRNANNRVEEPVIAQDSAVSMIEFETDGQCRMTNIVDLMGMPAMSPESYSFIVIQDRDSEAVLDLRCHDAARRDDLGLLSEALDDGVDVNFRAAQNSSALHWAANSGKQVAVAELLLRSGADVDAADSLGIAPLVLATMSRKYGLVDVLLSHGANKEIKIRCDGAQWKATSGSEQIPLDKFVAYRMGDDKMRDAFS